jgi:hypothetical protein
MAGSETRASPAREKKPRRPFPWVLVPAAALVLGMAWYVAARTTLSRDRSADRNEAFALTSRVFFALVDRDRARLERQCELLSDDPRLPARLSPAIDEPSVRELLADVRTKLPNDSVGLLSAEGRVITWLGGSNIEGQDLGRSKVVTAALGSERAASGLWGLEQDLVPVALRTVRLGEQPIAMVAFGASVGEQALSEVHRVTGHPGALVVGRRVVASAPPEMRDAFQSLAGLAPGAVETIAIDGRSWVARVEAVESRPLEARVIWMVPEGDEHPPILLWLPVLGALIIGIVEGVRADRRKR